VPSPRPTTCPEIELHYPRSHPSPIETCGSIADFDRSTSKLTVYMTTQAPHIIRAAVALVAELPEHMIRIISPDLGGGFGNKVPVYPGYVVSILASILTRAARQVDRGQDRQPHLHRLRSRRLPQGRAGAAQGRQDPRCADAHRPPTTARSSPTRSRASSRSGCMHSAFACYDIPAAHLTTLAASTPTRRPEGWPTGARSASPRRCSSRSGWSRPPPTSSASIRPSSGG
jgi:aerobic carbon-monoxide dehydrogenase large subunit